jgi:endonuclease/exonuclease/phosphatase family metal-dependent hydrolase
MSRRAAVVYAAAVILAAAVFFFYNRAPRNAADAVTGAGKAVPDKAAPLPDTVTAAFYNVENLFDFNLDGTEYDEYKPGWHGWSAEMQRKRLLATAEAIAAVGADVIGLCEVENKNTLLELAIALDRMGAPYPYAATADAPGSATVTALLSRLPIMEKSALPVEKSRSILEAAVARGGDKLIFFVNHWPSKRHPESTRLAAAKTLRRRLDSLPAGADYILIGDFNSNYDEYASFHTTGHDDTRGMTGINHILKTVAAAAARPNSPHRPVCKGELAACDGCHYNAWLDLEEGKRMSYVYRGAKQTIDNMLLPRALFDSSGYSYADGSFEAFSWEGRLLKDGAPYRRQMVYVGKQRYHKGEGYSDHLPIRARFVKAKLLPEGGGYECASIDTSAAAGDFSGSTGGWVQVDGYFSVARDSRYARKGSHSLRVAGRHDSQNRTAARAVFASSRTQRFLTMSVRGEGRLSIRLRRPNGSWAYHNAPEFGISKNAKYKDWKSSGWTSLKLPLPPWPQDGGDVNNTDVEVEIRAGKGESFSVWIDRVRLE